MKYSAVALIIMGSSLVAPLAFAHTQPDNKAMLRDSFYMGGDIGSGTLSTPDQVLLPPDGYIIDASYQTKNIAYGATIGFKHVVTQNFLAGTEFGYDYNGRSTYDEIYQPAFAMSEETSYKIYSRDFHVLATGTLMSHCGLNVFVKGGATRVDQVLRVTNEMRYSLLPWSITQTSLNGYKPIAAAGVGFRYKIIDIYAQYTHIFGENAENFDDLFNSDGTFSHIVSVDTYKLGAAVNISI